MIKLTKKYVDYFSQREMEGKFLFVLRGGRRSGKTFAICQHLLIKCWNSRVFVNIASMTAEQGRLGAFADFKTIIKGDKYFSKHTDIIETPREIRFTNGSRIFFNSYKNSETAKGIACDYLYINEANNFSKQQYTDLTANVRRGIFLDYNPNSIFWVKDIVKEEEILTTTWKDNYKNLTPVQLQYFANLKAQAERPDATDLDIKNYRIYYCGEYYELQGSIFNKSNIKVVPNEPRQKLNIIAFLDPSALRGADFFAMCLMCRDEKGKRYVLETWSENEGSKYEVVDQLNKWRTEYGEFDIYCETNGLAGINFVEFAEKENIAIIPYFSNKNKFERIVANYGELTNEVYFVARANTERFLAQVYEFGEKCDHDDNIDCVNSANNIYKYL